MKKTVAMLSIVLALIFSANVCLADVPAAAGESAPNAVETQENKAAYFLKDVDITTELGKSIKKLVDAGVVNGIPQADGSFVYSAQSPITRAQFCKMVNITFDYKIMADNIFWDVHSDQWYYPQILIAIHYGYIQGMGDGSFRGDEYITREQVCVILERVLKREAQTNPEVKWEAQTKPQISDEVSLWAKTAVENIVGLGYINLEEGGKFRAKENMTRGEFAFALDDFVKVSETPEVKPDEKPVEPPKEDKDDSSVGGGVIGGGNSGNNSSGDNTEKSYNITYVLNQGTLSGQKKTSYKKSDSSYTLPTPARSGYKFGGWYEKSDFSSEPVSIIESGSTGDKTYYAKWNKIYTIKYVLHPAEYELEEDPYILGKLDGTQKTTYTSEDEDYTLPIPTRDDGEEFLGWYIPQEFENVSGTIIMSDDYKAESIPKGTEGNLTYHALWGDMKASSDNIYTSLEVIIGETKDLKELDMLPNFEASGFLAFFETALPEVFAWKGQKVLVTNHLVRTVYDSEANQLREGYIEYDGDKEALKDEMGGFNSTMLLTLVNAFNINLGFFN